MKDVGTNKRVPLIVLLAVFVIGSTFIAYSLTHLFEPLRTVSYEKDFYQTDIVFSEDIECLDKISQVRLEIEMASKNDKPMEIKPITFSKGKTYELKAYVYFSVVNMNWHCVDGIQIRNDDGKWVKIDFAEGAGESKEYHNGCLDGTYVTVIGFDKLESHEKVLSEYKKARDDIFSSYRNEETLRAARIRYLPVCITLIITLAVSALVLFFRKRLTAAGRSVTPLTVFCVIIDIPVAVILLLYLIGRIVS